MCSDIMLENSDNFNKRDAFCVVVISSLIFVTYRALLFERVGGYWYFRGACVHLVFLIVFPSTQ